MNFRDKEVLNKFGRHLSVIRKDCGFTQEKLAYSADITLSQIARIETGRINPTLCTILKISETLNISPCKLIEFEY